VSSGWTIVDHACRHCFGRVLERDGVFRCADCAAETNGGAAGICGCGIVTEGGRKLFRCAANPVPSATSLALVVIVPTEASGF
jgi:hypothetical protein